MANENLLPAMDNSPYSTNKQFDEYLDKLDELRKDGEAKRRAIRNENQQLKLNKQIDDESKKKRIEENKESLAIASKVKQEKKAEVQAISKKALQESANDFKPYYQSVTEEAKNLIKNARLEYTASYEELKNENAKKIAVIKARTPNDNESQADRKKRQQVELHAQKVAFKSKALELRNIRDDVISKAKDSRFQAYMEKYGYEGKVRFDKHSPLERLEFKYRHYLYTFKASDYFLRNAIYFVLLLFFVVCVCRKPGLLSRNHLIGILGQSSTKVFYSLGVAGLILIAGTDLSIGRLTGRSVSLVCLIRSQQTYHFNQSVGYGTLDFTHWGLAGSFIVARLVSILACVLFTSIAGFFTAKFKRHPFITTLATQLVSFGLRMVLFADTPAFNRKSTWAKAIQGQNSVNLIIYAAIAIAIVWFIWNKTKFGKYRYAVGGNAEAANVSGINVFWVTMGIFIRAGVLYGLGGFFEATRVGLGNPSTGTGTELDAIAACVVGGISFNGGIGKVKGAVIGTLIFTALTYCLTVCKIDTNRQFIFKGVIIRAAVCLDSIKYLKKK